MLLLFALILICLILTGVKILTCLHCAHFMLAWLIFLLKMVLINKPTRLSNMLDLLLVSAPLTTYNVVVATLFSTSDHCVIKWHMHFPKQRVKPCEPRSSFKFSRAKYAALSEHLAKVDWKTIFTRVPPDDVNGVWVLFKQEIYSAISTHVPRRHAHNYSKAFKYPLFISRALKHKQALWHSRHTAEEKAHYNQ